MILLTPLIAMLSVVPVAMAMLPEKVEQVARAEASPEFWIVAVAWLLHWAADAARQYMILWKLLRCEDAVC